MEFVFKASKGSSPSPSSHSEQAAVGAVCHSDVSLGWPVQRGLLGQATELSLPQLWVLWILAQGKGAASWLSTHCSAPGTQVPPRSGLGFLPPLVSGWAVKQDPAAPQRGERSSNPRPAGWEPQHSNKRACTQDGAPLHLNQSLPGQGWRPQTRGGSGQGVSDGSVPACCIPKSPAFPGHTG